MPILIHAGRGLPAIADDLRLLVERHPGAQLILAHAAIADLQHIGRTLRDHPNVTYDTSVWSTTDLRALLTTVAPEQVLWASDLPYGQPATMIVQLARLCLRGSGDAGDSARHVLGKRRAGRPRASPRPALSPPLLEPPTAAVAPAPPDRRLHGHHHRAFVDVPARHPRARSVLAVRACDVEGSPELADVAELIAAARAVGRGHRARKPRDRAPYMRRAMRLLQVALAILDTP